MPPKIKELVRDLEMAGFVNRGGKGSHRNYEHPNGSRITILGNSQMMLNPIKFARQRKRLWSQNNERK